MTYRLIGYTNKQQLENKAEGTFRAEANDDDFIPVYILAQQTADIVALCETVKQFWLKDTEI